MGIGNSYTMVMCFYYLHPKRICPIRDWKIKNNEFYNDNDDNNDFYKLLKHIFWNKYLPSQCHTLILVKYKG